MSVDLAAEPEVGRKTTKKAEGDGESRRFGTLVRVGDDVAQLGRELAPMLGITMAELFTETLRPILTQRLDEEMRKRLGRKK